jgi:RNA polymerase sigma factor (sigma-70 family)
MDDIPATDILSMIRKGKQELAIKKLYKYYPMVDKFVRSNGGNRSDSEDLFQESLIVFFRKSLNPEFTLTCKAHTYLFKVAKYKWKDELIKKNKTDFLTQESWDRYNSSEKYNEPLDLKDNYRVLENVLQSLGDKCKQIFELYYQRNFSIQSIAEKLGYSSTNSTKTQKYKCMEQARLTFKNIQKNERRA